MSALTIEEFGACAESVPAAAFDEGAPDVPGRGASEHDLRLSIMRVVGGGTVDIQRNLVARALGLPR